MKYANFSSSTAGNGEELTPWTASQINGMAINDSLKIQGTYDHMGASEFIINVGAGNTIENWLSNAPWRFKNSPGPGVRCIQITAGTLRGGFFYLSTPDSGHPLIQISSMYNCYIYANPSISLNSCTIGGCYLTGNYTSFNNCVVKDTWVSSGGLNGNNNSTIIRCLLKSPDLDGVTPILSQTSYSGPNIPAWDATAESWLIDTFKEYITVPGTSPYTGYDMDPWGNTRLGLGLFNYYGQEVVINRFNVSSATAGQEVTSTIDKYNLISKIQAAGESGMDLYFTSSELKSVLVTYRHSDDRQRRTVIHTGSGLTGPASWSADAQDGTWEKYQVHAYDAAGAMVLLSRAQIGTGEDLTRSDGTMTLNT